MRQVDPWGQEHLSKDIPWWKKYLLYPLLIAAIIALILWLISMWASTPTMPIS